MKVLFFFKELIIGMVGGLVFWGLLTLLFALSGHVN